MQPVGVLFACFARQRQVAVLAIATLIQKD